MKKYTFLVVFLFITAMPYRAHAILPVIPAAIAAISSASIGTQIATAALLATGTMMAISPGSFTTATGPGGNLELQQAVAVYRQIAVNGQNLAFGYLSKASIDIASAYNQGLLQANTYLNDKLVSLLASSSTATPSPPPEGAVMMDANGTYYKIIGPWQSAGQQTSPEYFPNYGPLVGYMGTKEIRYVQGYFSWNGGLAYLADAPLGGGYSLIMAAPCSVVPADVVDYPPPFILPPTLTMPQLDALVQSFADDPAVAAYLQAIASNNTHLVAQPTAIPASAVTAAAASAIAAADDANVAAAAANLAANPTDSAALAAYNQALYNQALNAAKLAVEAAKEAEAPPETFSSVPAQAFDAPYEKEEVKFQERLQTFINRVRSSALFSLSGDFFNSVPSGGSPLYTINAGMFGTHNIDFSQTMTLGLAALRAMLLVVFGFLSIRAVILKR